MLYLCCVLFAVKLAANGALSIGKQIDMTIKGNCKRIVIMVLLCLGGTMAPLAMHGQGDGDVTFQDSFTKKMQAFLESDPLAITGTLGADMSAQWATDEYTSSPLALAMYANINLKIYNLTLPIHFNFMDVSFVNFAEDMKKASFPKPTLSIGMTPTIGNWKFHLGYSSMSFSKYTYSGLQFLGLGFEYQGKMLRAGGFGGTLKRPTRYRELDKRSAFQRYVDDLLGLSVYDTRPQFRREALGGKIGVGNKNNYFDLVFMKAKDDIHSLDSIIPYNGEDVYRDSVVQAKENLSIGAVLKVTPWKWMVFTANGAMSVFTADITAPPLDVSGTVNSLGGKTNKKTESYEKFLHAIRGIYTVRSNTQVRFAGDAALKLTFRKFSLGADYKFIQADFASLGIMSSQQNIQSIGGNGSWNMFDGKAVLSLSGYGQRDNMNKQQMYTNRVFTYNGSLSTTFGDYVGLSLTGNVVHQNQSDGTQEVDPLTRVQQLTYTANATPSVNFYTENSHSVNANFNIVETRNLNKEASSDNDSRTITVGAGYDLTIDAHNLAINGSYDFSISTSSYSVYNAHTIGYGLNYQIVDAARVKLGMSFMGSISYNDIKEQGEYDDLKTMAERMGYTKGSGNYYVVTDMKEWTFSNTLSFTLDTKVGHSVSLSGSVTNMSNRELIAQEVSTSVTASVLLGYSYSFAKRLIKHRTGVRSRSSEDL